MFSLLMTRALSQPARAKRGAARTAQGDNTTVAAKVYAEGVEGRKKGDGSGGQGCNAGGITSTDG